MTTSLPLLTSQLHTLPLSYLLFQHKVMVFTKFCWDFVSNFVPYNLIIELTRTIGNIIYHRLVVLGVNMSTNSITLGLKTFNHCWSRRFGLLTNLVWLCRRADDFVGYLIDVEDQRWCMLFELMEIKIFLESNGHEVGERWWWLVRWAIRHSPIGCQSNWVYWVEGDMCHITYNTSYSLDWLS